MLDDLLPELANCRNVEQNRFHHLPVFGHTMRVIGYTEQIIEQPEYYFAHLPFMCDEIRKHRVALLLAAMAHDLGKPETRAKKPDGFYSFYGHEKVSVKIFEAMAKRLDLDETLAQTTVPLIKGHMHLTPAAIRYMRANGTDKSIRKLLATYQDLWPALLAFSMADMMGTRGPLADQTVVDDLVKFAQILIEFEAQEIEKAKVPKRVLDGRQVMEALNLSPGKQVGRALCLAEKIAQQNPGISTEELLDHLKSALRRQLPKE
jgi:poly(A) polymerase